MINIKVIYTVVGLLTIGLVVFYSLNKSSDCSSEKIGELLKLYNREEPSFSEKIALANSNPPPIDQKFSMDALVANPNEFIYAYVNLPVSPDYGSNAVPLTMAALAAPPGDFLELGMGFYSTPLLHKIARDQQRRLVSVDTDFDWMNKFIIYNSTSLHSLYYLNGYAELESYGLDRKWSLVLVDHKFATKRPLNAIAFAQNAQIVVAHDTEKRSEGYMWMKNKMTEHFKYVCKFSLFVRKQRDHESYVSTTLMSNFIDLTALLKPAFDKVITEFGHKSCDVNL